MTQQLYCMKPNYNVLHKEINKITTKAALATLTFVLISPNCPNNVSLLSQSYGHSIVKNQQLNLTS